MEKKGTLVNRCDASPEGQDYSVSSFSHEPPSPGRPSTLKNPVTRARRAGTSKGQNEPGAVFFRRVTDKHRHHSEKAESRKAIQAL